MLNVIVPSVLNSTINSINSIVIVALLIAAYQFGKLKRDYYDQTDQERLLELEQRNELLESTLHEIKEIDLVRSEFLDKVSHDIRTPITAIKGSIDLLNMVAGGPLTDTQQELIDIAGQSVDRLQTEVEEIVSFFKDTDRHISSNEEGN